MEKLDVYFFSQLAVFRQSQFSLQIFQDLHARPQAGLDFFN